MPIKSKKFNILCLIIAAALSLLCLFGCAAKEEETAEGLARFDNATLGVVTGSLYGGYSKERFPDAQIKEYENFADVLLALKQGKVEGAMLDRPNFNAVKRTESGLDCIPVPEYGVEIGFGFQKNADGLALQSEMNAFLNKLKSEGKLQEMIDKWYGETEPQETIPLNSLTGAKTLRVSVDLTRKPFVYMYNGQPVGFEIEALYLFCQEYGYRVDWEDGSFAKVGLAGLAVNKYDMVCAGLYMTDARKETVNFSDPYMQAEVIMAIYTGGGVNFFTSLGENFKKTFVNEGRWKLILEGLGTTLLISVSAVLGGTVLGFLIYLAARSKYKPVSKAARGFAKVYSKIMAGMPILVILMILYYVVFGSLDISGVAVAILGFMLTFGSFVYNQLKLTVEGVDIGQTEAAYALGYGKNRTFFKIVLPQAMRMFAPSYSAQIVDLVKSTSVVGYIAVNDLTKMGDIIRSNTFEAFFPLLAVAVIYFVMIWGITALLGLIQRRMDPKRKKGSKKPQKEI